ncbi:unnamed protein product [Mytilus coruscus]|uniref:Endonuclease/exonuclease/phosphatase domain-containing protein n=1 Tax=Mytilus coruscus TaxID=42192 RepID=A0A6J8EYI8_MYTCO|nr:unnamed protein product [Mytilus coruscus]
MSFDQAKQKAQQKGETIPKIINSPVSEDETIPKTISTSNVTPGKSYADSVKSKVINNDTDIISDNEANMSPVDNLEINIDQNLNIETENTQIEDQTPSIPNKDRKNISDIRKTIIERPSKDITDLKNWETLITEIRNIADYQGGGVAIYVSIQVNFSQLNFNTDNIEVVGVSVNCQNNKINIVNVYRPPNQDIKFNDYQVLHNLSDNIVLLGDFNSRSSMWGSSTTDSNGNIIEKVIDQNNMIILNDGTGTFQTVTGNRTQIDLTLVSASLANDSQWSVLDDQLGSDHFPVFTALNAKPVKNKVCTPQRWIYDKADWHRFTTLCNEINIDNTKHDDIEIFNQNLCEVVTKIADETIPKTSGTVHTRKNCPWWNDDCTNAKKNKRHKHRVYDKTKSEENHELYKTAVKEFKRITDKAKTDYWQNFCNKLNYKTNKTILAESGEMPLQLRRDHLSLKYYARTKQNPSNPANQLVDDCIEYQIYNHKWNDHNIPYGFRVQNLLKDNDLDKIKLVTKNIQDPPPWIIGQAKTSSNIKNSISKKENPHIIKTKALEYIDNAYKNHLKIYTDGSKDPASGKTGYAFLIPSRPDILEPIQILACRLKQKNIEVTIEWIPAHVGILGNEQVDKLAKLALSNDKIDLNLSLSANEFIAITTALYKKKWQARWDNTCSLWSRSINNTVNKKPNFYQGNRYHAKTITRLRLGTTLLPGQLGQYIRNVSQYAIHAAIKKI